TVGEPPEVRRGAAVATGAGRRGRRRPWRTALVLVGLIASAGLPARGEEPLVVPNPRWGAFFSSRDQRVPIEPSAWPWSAVGRVNVADSTTRRHCTGTLVGARLVLTAGHCLFGHRLGGRGNPGHVQFVAGPGPRTSRG